ncbi:diguanylate cyclase [Niveispirillum fermenti]|uniref:diguanylate cyclase n=1 Tax=Niveispirillum fermenti TaxID=1233113 RepID=UPI003A884CEC
MSEPAGAAPSTTIAGLSAVVDEHLRWLTRWHRAAFFPRESGLTGLDDVPVPPGLAAWVAQMRQDMVADQPAIDRLMLLHEQLHRMGRLLLLRAMEGDPPDHGAYGAVMDRFDEFIQQCRRIERALSVAGSGIDPLTGLRNRTGLMEEVGRELARFARTGQPFCVALCDLDRFKSVNDTFGHEAGDRVLVAAAGCLGSGIRALDEAFRLGGEEILILLKETGLEEAVAVLDRLRADLAATPVQLADGHVLHVTASFGVACHGLAESAIGLMADQLLERADQALYAAKHGGRNRVEAWRPAHSPP